MREKEIINMTSPEYADTLRQELMREIAAKQMLLVGISNEATTTSMRESSNAAGYEDFAVITDMYMREGQRRYNGNPNITSSIDWEMNLATRASSGEEIGTPMLAIMSPQLATALCSYNVIGEPLGNRIIEASSEGTKAVFVTPSVAARSRWFIGATTGSIH